MLCYFLSSFLLFNESTGFYCQERVGRSCFSLSVFVMPNVVQRKIGLRKTGKTVLGCFSVEFGWNKDKKKLSCFT